ncbi:MAG: Clp protease ClpP [Clostridia bacterium]|nr:Clp protease ClpP [Clostridia bacterium]
MREINLNGYIDDDIWFGDEITPESLHEALYGEDGGNTDDVSIRLNSYGGSCNAATRMYDDIRAYPGNVHITISGTAASAATVLSMASDRLEMTPGSLYMIHDPSIVAWGNERDLLDSINLLRACKESILNVYARRCRKPRDEISAMMSATTWMDAQTALAGGFIDAITGDEQVPGAINAAKSRVADRAEAEAKVWAWLDRHKPRNAKHSRTTNDGVDVSNEKPAVREPQTTDDNEYQAIAVNADKTHETPDDKAQAPKQDDTSVPIAQLE